jgi:hypothetical protein
LYLVNALLLLSHHELNLGHRVSRLVYPITLFVFFLLKLLVPFSPFSHW